MPTIKKNIAGFYGDDGLFHPIRSPKFVGQGKRPATAKDKKKYSRSRAGDNDDIFERHARKYRNQEKSEKAIKARIMREVESDAYGEAGDTRNKGRGLTLAQFVRSEGGIRRHARHHGTKFRGKKSYYDAGEINRLSPKETGTTGLTTDSARGKYLDTMWQAAREAGYDVADMDDLISRIEDEVSGGRPTYKTHGYLSYNPATVGKSDLYVMQLGSRSYGVFLKTYLLKKFATKLAADNYMKSIKSRAKGNPRDRNGKTAGARSAKINPSSRSYKLAMAAAQDAGNRSMKKAGRKKWNKADYNAAVREFNRLMPAAKKNPIDMHPLTLLVTGLSGMHTALQIDEQMKKRKTRRKTSARRKTNGTTTAKRRKTAISNKQSAVSRKKKNPTAATLARCRKLIAADKRATAKQIAEIPISYHRRVANPSTVKWTSGKAGDGTKFYNAFVADKVVALVDRSVYGEWFVSGVPFSRVKNKSGFKSLAAAKSYVASFFKKNPASAKSPVKSVKKNGLGGAIKRAVKRRVARSKATREYSRELRLESKLKRSRARRQKAEAAAVNPKGMWVIKKKPNRESYQVCWQNADGSLVHDVSFRSREKAQDWIDRRNRSTKSRTSVGRKYRGNPAAVPRRRTFEMFQGRKATTAKAMPVSHFYAGKKIDQLGDLIELKLHSGRVLKFNPRTAKLCAAGGKLIIAGAKIAKPNPAGLANGVDAIDAIDHVVYRTYKPHHGDAPNQQYIHRLGEETGHMPLLCADKQGFPVIKGGRYKIEARGIVN